MFRADNGGVRSCQERRQHVIVISFADRRSEMERRRCDDRRSGQDRRSPKGFRFLAARDRRGAWAAMTQPFSTDESVA